MDVNVEVTIFDLSLKTSHAKYPWKVCSIVLTSQKLPASQGTSNIELLAFKSIHKLYTLCTPGFFICFNCTKFKVVLVSSISLV